MFSKILAGVFAVAVLTVGGYAYWNASDCPCSTPAGCPIGEPGTLSIPLPCCQEPSRATILQPAEMPCCHDLDVPAEVLAIEPREIK